jgi:hypothetical protein
MWDTVLREWKMIDFFKREARLTFKSWEDTTVKLVLFEEEEDVVKEMEEWEKGNQQQRE